MSMRGAPAAEAARRTRAPEWAACPECFTESLLAVIRATIKGATAILLLAVAWSAAGEVQPGAAGGGALDLHTVVEKVVEVEQPDGSTKTELTAGAPILPGDEVVYTVTFVNVSAGPADHVRITAPIPPELRCLADTAFAPGADTLYSVDGGATFGRPEELHVTGPDGSRRAATAADYTHVRWVFNAPLDAGATGFARFRAVVR
jgi:uncharacterized repeat protein (TIGR01451 family)